MVEKTMKHRRYLIYWVVGIAAIALASFLIPIVAGLYLTAFYTPNILEAHESVSMLQNEVAFGVINRGAAPYLFIPLVGMVIFSIIMYRKYSRAKVA